ncbi:fibronectin type III domain-containing protein [Paenibacillus montanisoli]|uniref:Fibronectin type-III domain-containing protein n=1 Tax=Paenibacillus montanisoli TaxID=2081970 RepID=A0A328U5Y9_9BACL|nr:fibronectin type III domain-containing protein [Paenibacillus montanisoli]RAP77492.1 hypothetical protein DL346_03155 [Paenibacillus montanisoli]
MKKCFLVFMLIMAIGMLQTLSVSAAVSDIIRPTHPVMKQITNITSTSMILSWTAASDNVGVVAYDLYKSSNGATYTDSVTGAKRPVPPTLIASLPSNVLTYTLTGLQPDTWYNAYYVKARDAAGNVDDFYSSVGAKTSSMAATLMAKLEVQFISADELNAEDEFTEFVYYVQFIDGQWVTIDQSAFDKAAKKKK